MPRVLTIEERLERCKQLGILVDEEDEWILTAFTWNLARGGHAYSAHDRVLLHHYIVGQPIYQDEVVDHKDRNPVNNRRNNLRYVTRSMNRINSVNQDYPMYNIWEQTNGRFLVKMKRNNVWHYATPQLYDTLEEAQQARDKLMKELDEGLE